MAVSVHHRYIDCVRGYAILLVIMTHLTYIFADFPYPLKRLTTTGWFGVQLFFLASAVTLLMSWHSELRRAGRTNIGGFFLRRFLRIAPAYYAAGLLYYFVSPPEMTFDPWQVLRSATFLNGWHPQWIPTTGGWMVVPGGWSISVEFSFYAIFPLMAAYISTLRRSVFALLASLAFGLVINFLMRPILQSHYDTRATDNFLYFWFPNQISVFAAGFLLFFLLRDADPNIVRFRDFLSCHAKAAAWTAILLFCTLAYLPQGHFLSDIPLLPAGQVICVPLMLFILALAAGPTPFVNRGVAALGTVSFSAYLIHFAVLEVLPLFPEFFQIHATGYSAIIAYSGSLVVAVLLTYGLAWASYHAIENPMIRFGKSLQRQHPVTANI